MRRWQSLIIAMGFLTWAVTAGIARAEDAPVTIRVVTEINPPNQYIADGTLTGPLVEIVQMALAEAHINASIEVLPWTRALRAAQDEQNVLIFSLGRTAEREPRFKWVGQIDEVRVFIYAQVERAIHLESLDDARPLVVGTVYDDIREKYLLNHGFVLGQNLASVRQHELNYAKLKAGRIDLWPASQDLMDYVVRTAGDDPAKTVKPVWEITDLMQGYTGGFMACSLSTSDDIVDRLRQALDQMKRDGRYAAIHKKWHSSPS